jgi:beta-glucosidase
MSDAVGTGNDGFPSDFLWGCATASYQIEGATGADGRGVSIWDSFCRTPGKVFGGMTGDVACDSYRKWKDDVELLRSLGVNSYRYSLAWPRIQPEGRGRPLQAGLDYYKRLADELGKAGIESAVTIYHWDLPQALEDEGGWPVRDTAYRFADFADIAFRALGDRVGRWFTLNEPWCSAFLGYESGQHAPGRMEREAAYDAVHHLLLAHGLGVQAHAAAGLKAPIGIVLNAMMPRPATSGQADVEAADRAADKGAALWFDPLYGRGYPERHLAAMGVAMPIEPGDMDLIASPIDFVGINYYSETVVEADSARPEGFREVPSPRPRTEMDWAIVPEGLYRLLANIRSRWPVEAFYITENGAAFADTVEDGGRIRDSARIDYLRTHIAACKRAIDAGLPVKGYYVWSLIDNFEWAHGYSKRFGLAYIDPITGARRPKDSFWFYRDVVAGNR